MHNNAYLVEYENGSYNANSPALEVGVVDGKVFLAIGRAGGTFTERFFTADSQIAVDVYELSAYLEAMHDADVRQAEIRAAR